MCTLHTPHPACLQAARTCADYVQAPCAAAGWPQAEKRAERQRRGNPETQTSDARFDEQFRFGHGVTGKEALPWWVGGWVGWWGLGRQGGRERGAHMLGRVSSVRRWQGGAALVGWGGSEG